MLAARQRKGTRQSRLSSSRMPPFFCSIASIGPANIASMPGSMTRTRTLVSSTPIWRVDRLAERVDGEVELVAGPGRIDLPAPPGMWSLQLVDVVGDAPPGLVAAELVRQVDLDRLLHWPTVGGRSAAFQAAAARSALLKLGLRHYARRMSWLLALVDRRRVRRSRRPVRRRRRWNPAAAYITAGQDEPGYRNWYMASPRHADRGEELQRLSRRPMASAGSSRPGSCCAPRRRGSAAARSRSRCRRRREWPHIVQTLRYIRDYVDPRGRAGRAGLGLSQSVC